MKNTELSYFLESLQGQSLLDLSPAPGGGITLHFESKCTSGHTDDLTLTPDIDFDGLMACICKLILPKLDRIPSDIYPSEILVAHLCVTNTNLLKFEQKALPGFRKQDC